MQQALVHDCAEGTRTSPDHCGHRPKSGEHGQSGVQAACIIRPESESAETVELHGKAEATQAHRISR